MVSPPPSTADPAAATGCDGPDGAVDARRGTRQAVVRGTSMRPGMERGDVLTVVAPDAVEPVRPGEVVTFLDECGNAVTHRLLGRDPAAGGPVMITQGDGRTEPDAPWPADRLVGRVTAAERAQGRLFRRMLALERLAWWEAGERLATRLRSWRPVRRLQRRLVPSRLTLREERRAADSGEWLAITCTACDARGRAAGWQTTLRQGPDTDARPLWLFFGLQVRLRYRGIGLSRRLLAAAEAGVAREGGGRMYAFVRPDNRPSLGLFRSSGWRAAAPPAGTVRVPELATCLCFVKDV
jgi:signal peptidase I